ncbi:P-loop containing nucleoside triphosphate hydrolase protein, partial [Mycena rosella]
MAPTAKPAAPKPLASKVRIYKTNEIVSLSIAEKSQLHLGKLPHEFQTQFFSNVMQGKDIVLDIGTGSGKSTCFDLPLLTNKKDIVLIVSPLTALMLEQAASSPLESIAICQETMAAEGRDALIFVSPEVAGSLEFSKKVLGQARFQEHLRLVVIDEAHCVSLLGGSFRSEYAELGVLRGRVPSSTVFAIASATLPAHVLDDVCAKLKIGKDAVTVCMSNARPNVALSCRTMIVHPDDTKANLRFLIPNGATTAAKIPISLVYFNQRIEAEEACDRLQFWASEGGIDKSAIAFYHAKIGTARKRELERMLRDGTVRILCCTDAVGMGCDMRNIQRVILWKLPLSFCALAQRSGRAVRDFDALGEAILFVPAKVLKDGIAEEQARLAREEAAEPQNQEGDEFVPEPQEGLDVVVGQEVVVAEGGVRVEQNAEAEEDDPEVLTAAQKKKKRKAARVSQADALEAKVLSRFACVSVCRRLVWDEYFENGKKPQLVRPVPAGARCCDNCEPSKFLVELVEVEKIPGLKGGKKRKWPTQLSDAIRTGLRKWSRDVLMPLMYPPKEAGFSMTGSALPPDSTIEQIAMCGERVDSVETLQRRARWFLMPMHGAILLQALQQIFDEYDLSSAAEEDGSGEDEPDLWDIILAGGRGRGRGRGELG